MPKKPDGDDTSQLSNVFQLDIRSVLEDPDISNISRQRVIEWLQSGGKRENAPTAILNALKSRHEERLRTKADKLSAKARSLPAHRDASKQRRISSDTINVLTRLDESIAAATKHLRKMPGARSDEAIVNVNSILREESNAFYNEYYLTFFEDAIEVCNEFCAKPDDEHNYACKALDKFDANTRIKLCGYIPDLIAAAKAAEEKVRNEAEDVIARIEQAIAQSMEVVK